MKSLLPALLGFSMQGSVERVFTLRSPLRTIEDFNFFLDQASQTVSVMC